MTEKMESHTAKKVAFSAKNIFDGDRNAQNAPSVSVAPDACAADKKGPAGIVLTLVQNVCGYEDFSINGVAVAGSVVTGLKTSFPDGTWTADGYEWGCLTNGERFLSKIFERGDAKGTHGTWKLLEGTGSLAGIAGEAAYTNAPKAGDRIVVSTLTGWYSLREASTGAAA